MASLNFLDNPYVFGALALVIILYGNTFGRPVPLFIKNLFQHPVFQIILFSLIAYRATHNPPVAVIIAITFLLIMTFINHEEMKQESAKIQLFMNIR